MIRSRIRLTILAAAVAITCLALLVVPRANLHAAVNDNDSDKPVTYTKDIAPIFNKNCASCHRTGEVAPFALLSYKDAAKHARQIETVTQSRYMPPWKPEPGFAEFQDMRRLSDSEIALIKRWVDSGAPEGKASDLPPTPKFTDGWQMGQPDLVLKMPDTYTLKAEGNDVYQCFVIPINNDEEKYVSAIEFRPGNRKSVHHALLFLDNTGTARKLDAADPDVGYRSFGGVGFQPTGGLGGWAPGAVPYKLPPDTGRPVRKGSDLVLQIHYHPTGKPEPDQSTVGIYFLKKPPKQIGFSLPLAQPRLYLPPGENHIEVKSSFTAPADLEVVGVAPHMHLLGREMKVTATLPDGTVKPMIWIKDWDFNWQGQYLYEKPMTLPKGTRLDMVAYYDNSTGNLRNPNTPPKRVTWGEQTTDEMALCFVQLVVKDEAEARQLRAAMIQQQINNGTRVRP